jgi:hypothetical protein
MDVVSAHRPVVAHGKPGTAADVDDMKRMNRPQELNVRSCHPSMSTVIKLANSLIASLLSCNVGWLCGDCGFDMAFCPCVSSLFLL